LGPTMGVSVPFCFLSMGKLTTLRPPENMFI
jgi:hypothetical protein